MGSRLVPSAVWFLPVLATLSDSWGLRWTASSPWFNFHFLPSEKFSAKLFFSLCCIGMFPVLQGLAPSGFCETSCILGSALSYAQLLLWKGICACTFLFLRKLSSLLLFSVHWLTITQLKWLTCSSLAFSVLLLLFKDNYCVWPFPVLYGTSLVLCGFKHGCS